MKINTIHFFTLCLLLGMGLGFTQVNAQNIQVCGTDELRQHNLQQNPALQAFEEEVNQSYATYMENLVGNRTTGGVRKIPVVIHVIQNSAVISLTDAEIYSQIEVLNEDYRKVAGTNGDGDGVDTQYEFCLASIDPSGCPTTGINRLVNPALAFHEQGDAFQLKGLIQWDPNKYLNIWLPKTIETQVQGGGQILGYATFPSNLPFQPNLDGIVIHSSYFGRNSNSTYVGRTATHEVGHWLGLYHTFQGSCSGSSSATCLTLGDGVCDTPQAFEPNFGCPTINSCTDSPVDLDDQIANYMDYSNGTCQSMLTQGQKGRMDYFVDNFRGTLTSAANLTATGCDGTTSAGCAPTADFAADIQNVCVNQAVTFSDLSSGPATSWAWTFNGGTPATSTDPIPVVSYSTPGSYSVTLVATNTLGNHTELKTAYITVTEASLPPVAESFEGILFYPQGWYTEDQGGDSWTLYSGASTDGVNSMVVENFEAANTGAYDNLISEVFDLSGMGGAELSWDYSYKKYTGFRIDTFRVRISNDCGATWNTVWDLTGPYLPTVPGNGVGSGWVPSDTSHWKTISVNIDSFAGEPDIRLMFKVISGNGQNLYLDNINMSTFVTAQAITEKAWSIHVGPNPFQHEFKVEYSLAKATAVQFYLTDLSGKVIYDHQTGKQAPGTYQMPMTSDLYEQLASGVYFLKAESDFGSITKKLVKMAD